MTSGAATGYVMQSTNATGTGSWTPLATMVSTLAPSTFSSNAWTILGNAGTNSAINYIGTTDAQDLTIRTNNSRIATVKNTSLDEIVVGSTANEMTIGQGFNTVGNGARYLGFNLKRTSAGVFESQGFGGRNGMVFMYTDMNGEFGFGSRNTAGGGVFSETEANVTSRIKWIFNFRNQLLTVGTSSLQAYGMDGTDFGLFPQFSAIGNTSSGLFIGETAKSVVGLKNGGRIFLQHDNNSNILFSQTVNNPSNASLTGAINNILFNPSFINGSSENVSIGYNNITGGGNNFLYTWSHNTAIPGIRGNTVNNSARNFVVGYRNNLTNIMESYVIGTNINMAPAALQYQNFVFGSNMNINATGVAIGENITITNSGAMCFGQAITSVNNGLHLGSPSGTRVVSNAANTTGVTLAAGGGAWATLSDRNLKENIIPVSNKEILNKVLLTKVTEWNYLSQRTDSMNKYSGMKYDKAPVHIGPMAQDFSEIFGYGEYKDRITSSDIDGVMFTAIQALAEENKELKGKIENLEKIALELEELKKVINEIKNR
jgi:hypothetical protein